jgi:hypothetical protein
MVLSGLSKGLIGLFSETMLFAREMRLLDEAMEICNEFYPGVMEVVTRLLPTYPQHAARRSEELQQVEETMLLNGVAPHVIGAVREVISSLAEVDWPKNTDYHQWALPEIIEEIYRDHILHAPNSPVQLQRPSPDHHSKKVANGKEESSRITTILGPA